MLFDRHEGILGWAYEPLSIPYYNPIKKIFVPYIPDFLVIYEDRDGRRHAEMLEIKPRKQSLLTEARSIRDRASVMVNQAKWAAARKFCANRGMTFRVITEDQLFATGRNRPSSRRKRRRR